MAFLTDRTLATGVTLQDLIHIVITGDTSQGNFAGSSYKATVGQVADVFSNLYVSKTGDTMTGTLIVPTISATTYQNLPIDPDTYVTGYTYSNNTFTIKQNNGQADLTSTINSVTGLTVNGNLTVTGNTSLQSTTASTLNISSTPTTDTNLPANYLTRDSTTGEVKVKTIPGPTVYGLFAQTGNSVTVSGTTSELSIVGSGVGTLSVPTNGFSVGDSFAVRVSGDLGANNGNTLTLRVKSGSAEFGVVGPISMPNVTSSHFSFEITFTIRAVGTAGNAKIQSSGFFTFTQNAGSSFEGDNFSTLNDTTFDTTIPNVLDLTAQFNSTNAANFIFTEILVLNKIY
jgi:hypothetical protein